MRQEPPFREVRTLPLEEQERATSWVERQIAEERKLWGFPPTRAAPPSCGHAESQMRTEPDGVKWCPACST